MFLFTDEENEMISRKENSQQEITLNVFVNSQNNANFELYYYTPLQMFSKKINSLKYFFDFTNTNTENINIEITSPNFENNFYPDFSFVEYNILSSKFDNINIKTEYLNIDSLDDMVYLLHHKSDTMKVIKKNKTFETNDNDVSVVFRTDCSVNVGRFKILVSFTRDNDKATTQNPVITTSKAPQTYTTYSQSNTVPNISLCSSVPVELRGSGTIYSPNYSEQYKKKL